MHLACPAMMAFAALAMDCRPEEQKRLTVCPAVVSGKPELSASRRPMFRPCSASGIAQPQIRSSARAGSKPGFRSRMPRSTCVPKSAQPV